MKLVVDTNILFTFFWKDAVAMQLFIFQDLELYAPAFALEEIEKYNLEIKKRANISDKGFEEIKKELQFLIDFVPAEKYNYFLPKAAIITPDSNDVDFFALALQKQCPLWSNDDILKQQNKIKVMNTKEIIALF